MAKARPLEVAAWLSYGQRPGDPDTLVVGRRVAGKGAFHMRMLRPEELIPGMEVQPSFDLLYRDIEDFVDEVTHTQLLSGIVSLKSHDNYTFEHSVEVAVVSLVLAKALKLSREDMAQLALGCMCHDLGKVIISMSLLNKPGKLSPDEFEQIKMHPQAGYEVVRRLTGQRDIVARNVVRQHHEKQDGSGYPQGLRGTNCITPPEATFGRGLILQAAEIAAVADVYSAIASDRPHRPAMPPQQVAATLLSMAGKGLNYEITRELLRIIPSLPVGTEVSVASGRLRGYRGIVSSVRSTAPGRPVVRILYGPNLRAVAPFEVDTGKERGLGLAISPLPARGK